MARNKANKLAIIISIIATIVVVAGAIAVFARLDKIDTTRTVGTYFSYEVGKLDQTTGKAIKNSDDVDDYKQYMHLKSYINADGLKCKIAEKATIEYKVYLFNENYQLVKATGWKSEDFSVTELNDDSTVDVAEFKYAIVEIKAVGDPDDTISTSEINKYAKMLTVTYTEANE